MNLRCLCYSEDKHSVRRSHHTPTNWLSLQPKLYCLLLQTQVVTVWILLTEPYAPHPPPPTLWEPWHHQGCHVETMSFIQLVPWHLRKAGQWTPASQSSPPPHPSPHANSHCPQTPNWQNLSFCKLSPNSLIQSRDNSKLFSVQLHVPTAVYLSFFLSNASSTESSRATVDSILK